jgi:predicted phosphodiesterase
MDTLCGQILKLLDKNIRQGTPITDVVILSTGDNANGENIYETQVYEQEMAPPTQVMLVIDVLAKLIVSLLKRGLPVSFYGIKGNHGRLAKDADPSANWDLMIYIVLEFWAKFILKNKNLTVKYAETDHMIVNIKSKRFMIRHIAPENTDAPSGRVKFNEWARKHKLDAIVYGHWHHFAVTDVDGIRVFRGASVSGEDSLSENMAKHAEPIQLIWGVNQDRAMTFFYAVDLRLSNEKE